MNIVLAINWVNYNDISKKKNQDMAINVLNDNAPQNIKLVSFNFEDDIVDLPSRFDIYKTLKRNSIEIGNSRSLPYIKEIFQNCANMQCDIFGYVNSDILLNKKFFNIFNDPKDVYVFGRFEIDDSVNFNLGKFNVLDERHPGYDGFFFRKEWWINNEDKFNDNLILGEPSWDLYYKKIIEKNTSKATFQRALYHVYHETAWNITSNGAKNNIKICWS